MEWSHRRFPLDLAAERPPPDSDKDVEMEGNQALAGGGVERAVQSGMLPTILWLAAAWKLSLWAISLRVSPGVVSNAEGELRRKPQQIQESEKARKSRPVSMRARTHTHEHARTQLQTTSA